MIHAEIPIYDSQWYPSDLFLIKYDLDIKLDHFQNCLFSIVGFLPFCAFCTAGLHIEIVRNKHCQNSRDDNIIHLIDHIKVSGVPL